MEGFTLIELVVVITILGILAAFAIPRLIGADASARIASVKALAGAMDEAATLTHALCVATAASTGCSDSNSAWISTINGNPYWLNYGWPDSGDALASGQIDSQIDYTGFQVSLVSSSETLFVRADAPNPANCSVAYYDAYYTPTRYHYVITTSGC